MPPSHVTISDDSDSPCSGSPEKYEWIWDSSGRAKRLPPSQAPPTPENFTSDEEDSHFVRRGGSTSECAQMRALRAANRDQEIEIEMLREAVSTYVLSKEVFECINIQLEDQVGELGVSYPAMYNSFLETRLALSDALETSTAATTILSIMTAVVAILFAAFIALVCNGVVSFVIRICKIPNLVR